MSTNANTNNDTTQTTIGSFDTAPQTPPTEFEQTEGVAVVQLSTARKKLTECPGCGYRFDRSERVSYHVESCDELHRKMNAILEARHE